MCGINAIISDDNEGIFDLYESLYHLQHRGQDSFGLSYIGHNSHKIETLNYNTLLSSSTTTMSNILFFIKIFFILSSEVSKLFIEIGFLFKKTFTLSIISAE